MTDAAPNPSGGGATNGSPADTKRAMLAMILSALVPGAGQLLLGQRRKGIALLLVFAGILCCIWPLRLPRFLAGLVLPILSWIALSIYGACVALIAGGAFTSNRPSKWLLLAVPVCVYIGLNLIFTPLLLVSSFRALKFGSSAMETTLLMGDQFIVDRNYYHEHQLKRDDLVVMRTGDYLTVKRVIAIGGDTIAGKDRQVLVNGQLAIEPFIQHSLPVGTNPELDGFDPLTIPAGRYFVMGDNRDLSLDSRTPDFGLVNAEAIVGKPLYVYRSPQRARVGRKLN